MKGKYQSLFLLLASSGLRLGEVLSLRKRDVYPEKRMVVPRKAYETNTTKKSWVSFYNVECEKYLTWLDELKDDEKIFPTKRHVYDAFEKANKKTGIKITP